MDSEGLIDDLFKKISYPYEKLNLENMSQSLNLTNDYWSTITQYYPCGDDIKRTQQLIDKYNITTPQQLTMIFLKVDVLQLADVLENFVQTSNKEFGINLMYSYSAPGFTWNTGLKLTKLKLDFLKDTTKLASGKEFLLLLENNIRGGISSVMGDRHVVSDVNKQILYIHANNLNG